MDESYVDESSGHTLPRSESIQLVLQHPDNVLLPLLLLETEYAIHATVNSF